MKKFRAFSAQIVVLLSLLAVLVGFSQNAGAQTFTITNGCSYTVFPGIFPAVFDNGGWSMAPGTSVSFAPGATFNGRIWGRIGCNTASPAVCSTGSCGGTGLQCAGTTGQAGTSLAEFNLNAAGTDFYDVSYVDGFDNPIGVRSSNASCASPNTCTNGPLTNCPAGLKSGIECLSPCTATGNPQFCCAGAFGSPATCITSAWPAADLAFNTNIHNFCPGEYAFAFDDAVGLHTCPTGGSYTITFCPNGSGSTGGTPPPPPPPPAGGAVANGPHVIKASYDLALAVDDFHALTTSGNPVTVFTVNGTGAQSWNFSNVAVVPAGNFNMAVLGPNCLNAAGTADHSGVNITACNGSSSQSWKATASGAFFTLSPANAPGECLDAPNFTTTPGTNLQIFRCDGATAQLWQIQ